MRSQSKSFTVQNTVADEYNEADLELDEAQPNVETVSTSEDENTETSKQIQDQLTRTTGLTPGDRRLLDVVCKDFEKTITCSVAYTSPL